jgi:hypothetical protein
MQSINTLQLMFVHFSEGVYKNGNRCCCCYLGKGAMSVIVVTGYKGNVCINLCFLLWDEAVASICLEHWGSKFLSPSLPPFSPLSFLSLSLSPSLPPFPSYLPLPSPQSPPTPLPLFPPSLSLPLERGSGGPPRKFFEFYIAVGEF